MMLIKIVLYITMVKLLFYEILDLKCGGLMAVRSYVRPRWLQQQPSVWYLGLVLGSLWDFGHHFLNQVPKLVGAAHTLARLLTRMRAPDDSCRRLYAGVVRAMAFYGLTHLLWTTTIALSPLKRLIL